MFDSLTIFSSFIRLSDLFLKGNVRNSVWMLGLKGLKGVFQDLKLMLCFFDRRDLPLFFVGQLYLLWTKGE